MDKITPEEERAERDADLLRMAARGLSLLPTERQRLLELRDARRDSERAEDVVVVETITAFFGDGGRRTAADR